MNDMGTLQGVLDDINDLKNEERHILATSFPGLKDEAASRELQLHSARFGAFMHASQIVQLHCDALSARRGDWLRKAFEPYGYSIDPNTKEGKA